VSPPAATMCPATMCPLFAAEGSPWTGEKNAPCEMSDRCAFWSAGRCDGAMAAREQVAELAAGYRPLQIGPRRARRIQASAPRAFDCPHAAACQWQVESLPALCPPREALRLGLDPKACAW